MGSSSQKKYYGPGHMTKNNTIHRGELNGTKAVNGTKASNGSSNGSTKNKPKKSSLQFNGSAGAVFVPKSTKLEFGGIIGAHLMVLGLPVGVLAITLICNKVGSFTARHRRLRTC